MTLKRKRPITQWKVKCNHNLCDRNETETENVRFVLPRDLVKPNFQELSETYPEFQKAWMEFNNRRKNNNNNNKQTTLQAGKKSSCFSTIVDHAFNVALTRALLDKHFKMSMPCLPKGYLCPPIPNRLNYVLWIKRLLNETIGDKDLHYRGMDLGTGVSAIYPLLLITIDDDCCSSKWKIIGTDIDPTSVQCAKENVKANHLQNQIYIEQVPLSYTQEQTHVPITPNVRNEPSKVDGTFRTHELGKKNGGPIESAMEASYKIEAFHHQQQQKHLEKHCQNNKTQKTCLEDKHIPVLFDFCMTNPPFYGSEAEAQDPRVGDGRCRTDMTLSEGTYPGGEVGFVMDMIRDSFYYGKAITWYSSMVGKKSTLLTIEKEIKKLGFGKANLRTTEFVQGKTRRWGIAWTFHSVTLKSNDTVCHPVKVEFDVILEDKIAFEVALEKVVERVQVYCKSFEKITLKIDETISENSLPKVTLAIFQNDEALKSEADCSNQSHPVPSLPIEGNFFVSIVLSPKDFYRKMKESDNHTLISVKVSCFSHSKIGTNITSRICSQLQGEICRSNRKWRRLVCNK